jgi:hypothetical protein
VDHRGLHAPVPQELLDRPDVVPTYEQMGREGMAERMAGRVLGDADLARCIVEGSLDRPLVEMMATSFPVRRAGLDDRVPGQRFGRRYYEPGYQAS